MSAQRPHVMLVERWPGEDARLDDCVERVRNPAVQVIRYGNLWQALVELRQRQTAQQLGALAVLDLVGHGEAGALSVGDAVLDGSPQALRWLAQLLNPPALVDGQTVLRLLGCGVGVGGLAADLPTAAHGDGPWLALAVRRRLGCQVHVTLRGVDPHDFTADGFASVDSLGAVADAETCRLVAVTANPAAP